MGAEPASNSHILALVKQTIVYGIGGIALQAVGVITLPIFARVFSTAEYGLLELGTTLSAVALALVDAGFASAAQRSFYDYDSAHEPQRKAVVFTAFSSTTAIGAVAAVLLILGRDSVSAWLFGDAGHANLVVAVALTIPLINSASFLREAMRLRFRAWHYVLSSVVGSFGAAAIAIVAVVALDKGVMGFFIGLICGNAIATLYGLYAVRHDLRARYDVSELRTMLAYGLPLVPAALALWALALVDRILLRHLDTLDSVGEYAVANRVAYVLLLAVTGFQLAFGPYIFSIYAEDRETERQVRALALRYLAIVLCGIGLALTLFAREIIDVVAPSFDTAYQAVGPLVLGVIAFGFSSVVIAGISYVRRTSLLAGIAVVAAGTNIALNFALIPPFGIVGAACATTAAYALLAAVQYHFAQRLYPTPYDLRKVLATVALAAAFAWIGLLQMQDLGLDLVLKSFAVIAWALALRLAGIVDAQDVLKIRDVFARVRLRGAAA